MNHILSYILLGYCSGSVLFARVSMALFHKDDMINASRDKNPGTFNAFLYGGFLCGLLTLAGDLLKGFLPVSLFLHACLRLHMSREPRESMRVSLF